MSVAKDNKDNKSVGYEKQYSIDEVLSWNQLFDMNRDNEGILFRWLANYIPQLFGAQYANQYQMVMRDCFYSPNILGVDAKHSAANRLSLDERLSLFSILRDDILRVNTMINGDVKDINWDNIYDTYTLVIEDPAILERVIDIMLRYQNKLGLAVIASLEQCLKKRFLEMLTAEQRVLLQRETTEAIRIGFYQNTKLLDVPIRRGRIYGIFMSNGKFNIIDNISQYRDSRFQPRSRACNTIDLDKLIFYAYASGMPIPVGINRTISHNITREELIRRLLAKQPGEKRAFKLERDSIPSFDIDKLRYYYILYSLSRDQLCKALESHFT